MPTQQYTPQVQINPSFAQYMQSRAGNFAMPGQQGSGQSGLNGYSGWGGGSFGFPMFGMPYGYMYGNTMQSGQQTGVPSGVFGMPSQFTPALQQQQQNQQAQNQQQQSAVQQVANANYGQTSNLNLADPTTRNTFLDEYKKLYTEQLAARDPKFKQLQNAYTDRTAAYERARAANVGGAGAGHIGRGTGDRSGQQEWINTSLARAGEQEKAKAALDAYLNPMWDTQQKTLDTLFSGQITPQMLLQNMTRGLLG